MTDKDALIHGHNLAEFGDSEKEALLLSDDHITDATTWVKAYAMVEAGGLGDRLLAMTAKPSGRKPVGLTIVDVLAGTMAVCLTGGAPEFLHIAKALHAQMPADMRKARGITRCWPAPTTTGTERRRMQNCALQAVRRRFYALIEPLDVYRGVRHEHLDLPEMIEVARRHVAEDPEGEREARVRNALLTVMNDILQGSLGLLPDSLLAQMGVTVALDGTFLATFARSGENHQPFTKVLSELRGDDSTENRGELTAEERDLITKRLGSNKVSRISTDPESGHYARGSEGSLEYKGNGYEGHLVVVRDDDSPTGEVRFPALTGAISIDTPGYRPAQNGIAALSHYRRWAESRDVTPRYAVFDALYWNLRADTFHLPLRRLGIGFIGRIGDSKLGKLGVSHEGYTNVEGTLYCDFMPKNLVSASQDRVAGRITEEQYQVLLKRRETYEFYRINGAALATQDGQLINPRGMCPASRPTSPVQCPRKNGSENNPGQLLKVQRPASTELLPKACVNKTLQIPADLIAKEQAFPYMSPQWRARNDKFRSANEGTNGVVKDPAGQGVGIPGRRRVRGLAPNGIMVAIQLAAANVHSIRRFLQSAEPDGHGVMTRVHSTYRRERLAAKRDGRAPNRRRKQGRTELRPTTAPRAVSARTANRRT